MNCVTSHVCSISGSQGWNLNYKGSEDSCGLELVQNVCLCFAYAPSKLRSGKHGELKHLIDATSSCHLRRLEPLL